MAEEEKTIPKHRLDEESSKRKEAEKKVQSLENRISELETDQAKKDSDYKKLYEDEQKKAQNLQKKLNDEESDKQRAETDLTRYKQRIAFSRAAQGVIRADAVDDAFSFLTDDDLSSLNGEDSYQKAAQKLADDRTYLAETQGGSGSRGSSRPIKTEEPATRTIWNKNQRNIT